MAALLAMNGYAVNEDGGHQSILPSPNFIPSSTLLPPVPSRPAARNQPAPNGTDNRQ